MQQTKILICFFAIFGCSLASDRSYQFGYGVEDLNTGDIKSHHETKIGDQVSGAYTLLEADGTTRVVKYTAGPHTGFNAVVEKEGIAQHPAVQQQNHQEQQFIGQDWAQQIEEPQYQEYHGQEFLIHA